MTPRSSRRRVKTYGGGEVPRSPPPPSLQVLAGVDDALDGALLVLGLAHEGFDVHDPLPLLTGDLGPVVGVGRVWEVLVLLELLANGGEEVVDDDALVAGLDVALEGELLGAAHDGLDHGAGSEVLEVEDLLVAIGVGDLEEAIVLLEAVHLVQGGGDHAREGRGEIAVGGAQLVLMDGKLLGHVLVEDIDGGALVGALDLDLHIEAAGAEDGRIDEVLAVAGADDDDVLDGLDAIELGEELGDDGGFDVGGDAGAAGAEEGVHLVEEDDDGDILGGFFAGLDEDLADLALGLADVLVEELGALDGEEEALDLFAAFFGDAGGEVVGDGFGDHGLAAAGRAVEEHALGRGEMVFLVVVAVEVGELDGVLDGLDLGGEAADVLVADVGDFLEGEVFDLALGELFEEVAALAVHEDVIADLELDGAEGVGDDADLVLVGALGDDGAVILEDFLEDDDLTLDLVAGGLDDVEALVEDQFLAGLDVGGLDGGVEVDLHLAALGEDVDGAVLVLREVDAVGGGRSAQLVHFLPQRRDLFAGVVQRVHQLLIASHRLGQLPVDVAQLTLGLSWILRRISQTSRARPSIERGVHSHGSRLHGFPLRSGARSIHSGAGDAVTCSTHFLTDDFAKGVPEPRPSRPCLRFAQDCRGLRPSRSSRAHEDRAKTLGKEVTVHVTGVPPVTRGRSANGKAA